MNRKDSLGKGPDNNDFNLVGNVSSVSFTVEENIGNVSDLVRYSLLEESPPNRKRRGIVESAGLDKESNLDDAVAFFNSVLNGSVYTEYPDLTPRDLFDKYHNNIDKYKTAKWNEFIRSYDGESIVPKDEFENSFQTTKQRLELIFRYQITAADTKELIKLFEMYKLANDVGTSEIQKEFKRQISSDQFPYLLNNFIFAVNANCFNVEGYEILEREYKNMENLFGSGVFEPVGAMLLRDAKSDIDALVSIVARDSSMDNHLGQLLHDLLTVLGKLELNTWQFDADDISFLTYAYKFFENRFPTMDGIEKYKKLIGKRIEEAIRKWRRPMLIKRSLLTAEDLMYINTAREIFRSSYGAKGQIKNSDIDVLRSIKIYLMDILIDEVGLLTISESDILNSIVLAIDTLLSPNHMFNTGLDAADKKKVMSIASERSTHVSRNLERVLSSEADSVFRIKKPPTQLFSTAQYNVDQHAWSRGESSVLVQDDLQLKLELYDAAKYILASEDFQNLYDDATMFMTTLKKLQDAKAANDSVKIYENLLELRLAPYGRFDEYVKHDLERLNMILVAGRIRDLENGKNENDLNKIYEEYKERSERLKKELFAFTLMNEGVISYIEPWIDSSNSGKESLSDVYAFIANEFNKELETDGFEGFVNLGIRLKHMDSLFGISGKIFSIQLDEVNTQMHEDANVFLKRIMQYAYDEYKPEYQLDEFEITQIKSAVSYCLMLRIISPRDDSSLFNEKIYYAAIDKFAKSRVEGF